MASRKAQTISVSKLIASVDKAVEQATRKQGTSLAGPTLITRWEIIGRMVSERIDMNDAFALATQVTRATTLQGLKVQPAVSRFGRQILIGFVARENMPSFGD